MLSPFCCFDTDWRLLSPNRRYAERVDVAELYTELMLTCRRLRLPVRETPFQLAVTRRSGGLVWLRGKAVVVVDATAPLVDRVAAVADALCGLELDPLGLTTEARRAIGIARARRRRELQRVMGPFTKPDRHNVQPLVRSKPGLRRCDDEDDESFLLDSSE